MKPQLLALLTAVAWGVGGYFEKKGLHLGQLSPQMGDYYSHCSRIVNPWHG